MALRRIERSGLFGYRMAAYACKNSLKTTPGPCLRAALVAVLTILLLEPACAEPDRQQCEAAVSTVSAAAKALPAEDLSRYFAERDLQQAKVEAGNGEFDECLEMAERAAEELRERRHQLPPGEKLKVLRADE